jgi:hypothetical protein
MDDIRIRVTKDELNFIREALLHYYEELDARLFEAEEEQLASIPSFMKSPNQFEPEIKPKKPHWTQTPEGKKILANRKPRGAKK